MLYARSSSAAVAQRFNNVEGRVIRLDLGKQEGLAYYFVSGGLPIVVEDRLIGAVGVGAAMPTNSARISRCKKFSARNLC